MRYYYIKFEYQFKVFDENGFQVATFNTEPDAKYFIHLDRLLHGLREQFSGLFNGVDDVNGADLVQFLTEEIEENFNNDKHES